MGPSKQNQLIPFLFLSAIEKRGAEGGARVAGSGGGAGEVGGEAVSEWAKWVPKRVVRP